MLTTGISKRYCSSAKKFFKLVEHFEDGRIELYNLAEDAGENRDLSREMPGRRNELHRLLKDWRTSVGAQLPTENPDYDRDWTPQRGQKPNRPRNRPNSAPTSPPS